MATIFRGRYTGTIEGSFVVFLIGMRINDFRKVGEWLPVARAMRPMLEELSRPSVQYGSTECSTCRLQMEEGSRKRTLHPAQYLALAYGLMPELARQLTKPIRALTLP